MKPFSDILVYAEVDDSNCLEQVVKVAAAHGAAITVCEVVPPAPRGTDSQGIVERVSKLRWTQAFRRLRRIVDHFSGHMVIDYSVFTGEPFIAITEQVVEQDFDLVVHISDPVQGDSERGLNPTGMHLMRKCPCAVWALHPQEEVTAPSPIILAVDREPGDDAGSAEAFVMTLAERALAMASATGSELWLMHAWSPFGVDLLEDEELGLNEDDRSRYRQEQADSSAQWFRRVCQAIDGIAPEGVKVRSQLIEGDPISMVRESAEKQRPSMLVLGTVGTSANPGVLIGETTESILAQSGMSVMTLKPPGFVSPLIRNH